MDKNSNGVQLLLLTALSPLQETDDLATFLADCKQQKLAYRIKKVGYLASRCILNNSKQPLNDIFCYAVYKYFILC